MRECHGPIFFASMTTKLPCELRALPLYRQARLNHQAELTGPIVRSPAADLRSRLHFEVFRPLQSGLPNPEASGAFESQAGAGRRGAVHRPFRWMMPATIEDCRSWVPLLRRR